jgi:Cu+-exporting ATPase
MKEPRAKLPEDHLHVDPVCGMTVRPETATATHYYKATAHYFCSESCAERFKR